LTDFFEKFKRRLNFFDFKRRLLEIDKIMV